MHFSFALLENAKRVLWQTVKTQLLHNVVRCFMSILVLHHLDWGGESWLLYFVLSSWCLVIVVWLFLTMPRVCLQFVIVVFSDHTHLPYTCIVRHLHSLISALVIRLLKVSYMYINVTKFLIF